MISATRIMSKNKELICRLSCYDIGEVFQEKTNKKNPENKVYIEISKQELDKSNKEKYDRLKYLSQK